MKVEGFFASNFGNTLQFATVTGRCGVILCEEAEHSKVRFNLE